MRVHRRIEPLETGVKKYLMRRRDRQAIDRDRATESKPLESVSSVIA